MRTLPLAWLVSGVAAAVWITASVAPLSPAAGTVMILLYAWLLAGADAMSRSSRHMFLVESAAVVALAAVKWVVVDMLSTRLSTEWKAQGVLPLINTAMGAGVLVSVSLAGIYWLRRRAVWELLGEQEEQRSLGAVPRGQMVLTIAGIVMLLMGIGISFEIDRAVERAATPLTWPRDQLKNMGWTMLWTAVACGFMALVLRLLREPSGFTGRARAAWLAGVAWIPMLLTLKYLSVDTLLFRIIHDPAPAMVVANLQVLTAIVVVAGLLMSARLAAWQAAAGNFLAVLVLLWAGTLEIDRGVELLGLSGRARQAGFSVFWSVFAIGCVVAGFGLRAALLRYFGLGLFAVTLLKVVLIDLSHVGEGWRILSFVGLGLLLLGTSVLYGRLSAALLSKEL